MTSNLPLPYMSTNWIQQRETGRRNRRIIELQQGWRYAAISEDRTKMLEIEDKIREIKRHMQREA